MKCLIVSLLTLSCFAIVTAQTFTDVTSSSGIGTGGGTWPSGVSLVDLDGDGDLDLFQSSHSGEATFRLNDGSGHFSSVAGTITNTELHNGYDINEDGKLDLTATVYDGNCRWWTNNSTPGAVNFTAANPNLATRQEALIDINRDGKVDWLTDGGTRINFHFGNGTGGFTVNAQSLFVFDDPNLSDDGMAPIPADLDGDGDIDLVVSWGRYEFEKGRTAIFRNDGNGTFTNVTTQAGLYQDSLAILGAGDYDGDGDIDLIGLEHNRFPHSIFLNDGAGHFTKKAGAVTGGPTGSPVYPGWGLASFTDFDNDGIGDIIVGGRQYAHVLRGTGSGSFEYKNTAWGITSSGDGNLDNTYAFGDIDNDGDLDIAVLPSSRTNLLYRNDLPAKNWLNVRPVGLAGNKGAGGAKIRIYENGTANRLWFEQVILHSKQAQQNYYGFTQTERHFGLGTRTICDVEVEFYPSGTKVKTIGVPDNVTVVINENGTASHGTVGIVKPEGQKPKGDRMKLDVWINPCKTTVTFQSSAVSIERVPALCIFDMSGKLVQRLTGVGQGSKINYLWEIAEKCSGWYFAQTRMANQIVEKQILLFK
jgi:enediyne biosynthesis protein E4